MRETPLPRSYINACCCKSHIRVGTFQYITVISEDKKNLKTLWLIIRLIDIIHTLKIPKLPALDLLKTVIEKQTKLIVTNWMRVGFIHGVMNTDNMAISVAKQLIMDHVLLWTLMILKQYLVPLINKVVMHILISLESPKWNLARFAESVIAFN